MERIFSYLAAFFTRFLFCVHAAVMIYWLVCLKEDSTYFVFLLLLVALLLEAVFTVGVRKGRECGW